jgi:bacterioferritin-associated ferredoxin
MYVCVCNAIRECEFRRMAQCVPGDAEAVYAALGKTPQCRQCLDEANELLVEVRQSSRKLVLVA